MIASLALAAVAAFTPAQCADAAKMREGWGAVVQAMAANDLPTAKSAMEAMIACGDAPGTIPPRALRADIASKEGDDALVVKLLSPVPVPDGPVGAQAAWLLLRTYGKLGDAAAFNAQRTRMLAAVDYALGDPASPLKGKLVERFQVGRLQVSAYEATLSHATAKRLFQFMVLSDTPLAEPEAILVTEDSQMTDMARYKDPAARQPVFIDRYKCNTRSNIRVLTGLPDYAQAKAVVVGELTVHPDISLGDVVAPAAQGMGCRWPVFSAPGIGD